jgi:hypothetical protein
MDDVSVDGAIAAATYFLSLYPYVYNTGDLTQWKAMSHPECIFCASVVTGVEEMHAKGNHQEGLDVTITSAVGTEVDPGVFFDVTLEVTQGPGAEVDPLGSAVGEPTPQKRFTIAVVVLRESDLWVIRAVEPTPADG